MAKKKEEKYLMRTEGEEKRQITIVIEDKFSKDGIARSIKVNLEKIEFFDALGVLTAAKFQMMGDKLSHNPPGNMDYVG